MVVSDRCLQSLVGGQGVFFQTIQVVVVKYAPPLALGYGVFWIASPPRLGNIPFGRRGRSGTFVLRTNGAPGGRQNAGGCNQKRQEGFPLEHYRFAPGAPFASGALG